MSSSKLRPSGSQPLGTEDIILPSAMTSADLRGIREKYQIPPEIKILLPPPRATADTVVEGFCCIYEIWLEKYGLRFPIHPLMFDFVQTLGLTLPQMCPNFVRMVMGLIVVAHEEKVELTLMDLVRLCVVKANSKHDMKCFYLSRAAGKGVISGLPSKDKFWGRRYFYFAVNEHSLGDRARSFSSKWASSPSMH